MPRRTAVHVEGNEFFVNGEPTYRGRSFRGKKVEGLLLNARLVQGIFDDLNPETRGNWDYPDGPWDAQRNTREFVAAMGAWRVAGLIGLTLNLQGGSPRGYSKEQPWYNSAFTERGELRDAYMARLRQILDRADELGMVVILGLFYFGQDERLADEHAVVRGVDAATDWLLEGGYRNILVEINNECNVARYEHRILTPGWVDALIQRVRQRSDGRLDMPAGRLLVSTSMGGGAIPSEHIVQASDFLLLHGNGVDSPDGIRDMVRRCRELAAYRGQPILFNEDDHFAFEEPDNHLLAAIDSYTGWGYFDYRMEGEGFEQGYQSVPVDWTINSARKRAFFKVLAEVTGAGAAE